MKKILLILMLASFGLSAQYNSAVGVGGAKKGMFVNYKYFTDPDRFIEVGVQGEFFTPIVLGGFAYGTYGFHKEIHSSILHTTRLSWYFSFGAHAGYFSQWYVQDVANIIAGPDVFVGAEYRFHSTIPLVLGAQGRGYYNILHTAGSEHRRPDDWLDFGVFLRYIIDEK